MDNDMGVAGENLAISCRVLPPVGPDLRAGHAKGWLMTGRPEVGPYRSASPCKRQGFHLTTPCPPERAAVPGRHGAWGHAPSLHAGSAIIHDQHNKVFSWDGSHEKNREKPCISRDCKRKGSSRAGFGRAVAPGGLWKGARWRRAAREKFSNGWKHFFQSLETRREFFPIIGKNGRIFPTIGNFFSNHWKTSARARARENSCFRGGIW